MSKDFMLYKQQTPVVENDSGPATYELDLPGAPTPTLSDAIPGAGRSPGLTPPRSQAVKTKPPTTAGIYDHRPEATTASGTVPNSRLKLDFLSNVLDSYDVVTYHWKLFMVDPDAAALGKIHNTTVQTIIAESGVTDLTIDNVKIESIATPSVESGTGTSTKVFFEIVEPAGAGLLDKIFYQSIALGIGNWLTMPMYLQLQFRARDPDTSSSTVTGVYGGINAIKWVWGLKISETKATVTTVGTVYNMEGILYNEYAQTNANFTLLHNIKLDSMETVGGAMADLQEKLNLDQLVRLLGNYSVPDVYEIFVDPAIANERVTPGSNTTDSARNNSMDKLDFKDGSFPPGTSIDKIIDSILAQTPLYQKVIPDANTPGDNGKPVKDSVTQIRKLWRIVTETIPTQFDVQRQDTARRFVIYIVQYDIGILEANVSQVPNSRDDAEVERKRLKAYADNGILRKKYNYIFTGLNDQVREFDITLNNAFGRSMSRLNGIYLNSSMSTMGKVAHDHAEKEAELVKQISSSISFINSSKTRRSKAQAKYDDTVKAIEDSGLSPESKERYTSLLKISMKSGSTGAVKSVVAAGGVANGRNTSRFNASNLAKVVTEEGTGNQFRFISDVNIASKNTQDTYTNYIQHVKGKIRPIPFVQGDQDRQVGAGVESSSNSGIQKVSSLFSTALHSQYTAALVNIKIKIKGDPFWLFPQPMVDGDEPEMYFYNESDPTHAIKRIKYAHKVKDATVNLYGSDNFMLLRFRTPRIYDETEPRSQEELYSDVNLFSGIYKVTRVTNEFNLGIFDQELECILDPIINLSNFTKEIEDAMQVLDVPVDPKTLVAPVVLPLESVRADRVNGTGNQPPGVSTAVRKATPMPETVLSATSGTDTTQNFRG